MHMGVLSGYMSVHHIDALCQALDALKLEENMSVSHHMSQTQVHWKTVSTLN